MALASSVDGGRGWLRRVGGSLVAAISALPLVGYSALGIARPGLRSGASYGSCEMIGAPEADGSTWFRCDKRPGRRTGYTCVRERNGWLCNVPATYEGSDWDHTYDSFYNEMMS